MTNEESDAWVAWSALAEPLDAAAGALLSSLGPLEALRWLREVERRPSRAQAGLIERFDAQLDARTLGRIAEAAARWTPRMDFADPRLIRRRAEAASARVLTPADDDWPEPVRDLGPAIPPALYVVGGDLATLLNGAVALVGSRAATSYGEHLAGELAAGIAGEGRAVVSGGAYGIDAAAHRGALAVDGATVAVMAGGVDRWYPTGTAQLREAVARRGCIVSEVPPGWAPHRSRFLSRNRLIACAAGTVVVEAAHRSGALSTARHAAELGRPVGAVPGPVTSAASAGCHTLIRDIGAMLVTSAAEALELVGPLEAGDGVPVVEGDGFGSQAERAAFDGIGPRGATLEEVALSAALTPREARAALAALSAAGRVELADGTYRRLSRSRASGPRQG
ncbi:DNA-processing protein DprA [Demequina sp. NBRC 110054]|uniref:DNA-processing protein DprA n=1 Tax=Demequina sp. NBRC 110054 TaxID=1570343 RepID=UPI001178A6C2|nr:DNA-processing protein DprA [Demequina sp. NBRC 110054]